MPGVVLTCPVNGCGHQTQDGDHNAETALALLNLHAVDHREAAPLPAPAPQQHVATSSGPKLERPKVARGITEVEWNMFVRRFNLYKAGSQIAPRQASSELFQCASKDLGDYVLNALADEDIVTKSEDEVLTLMKKFAVIPVAIIVVRSELIRMEQARDEKFRAFAARVKGKAETCDYKTDSGESYAEMMIKDVIIAGIDAYLI